ncbi:hypothetical protein WQ54_19335 [Bacillus sp. SA1-12]|uniref:hypothetical protein n=1 Tax=Bacillus sp. SA1-12 TaxID=1455638 RepID=UPI0006272622|nr:hypothetical protein [Bacillus sp. SA1-12]KKI90675.1 hypothetical protein WQ54_19335 [Bacillus sp. SA1-12]
MIVNEEITLIKKEFSKIYDSFDTKNKQQDEALLLLVSLIEVLKGKGIITQQEIDNKQEELKRKF